MQDMLVRLYALPDLQDALDSCSRQGVAVRRALNPEKTAVCAWVREHFPRWTAEAEAAFARMPVACFIAVQDARILGFACHDATHRNFFGPEGVLESARGRGLGRALLLSALHAQKAQGYAYSIIGGAGPAEFYARTVGAVPIAGSSPGAYAGLLGPHIPDA
jgi:GNAT superfamily N-acetyltransferase